MPLTGAQQVAALKSLSRPNAARVTGRRTPAHRRSTVKSVLTSDYFRPATSSVSGQGVCRRDNLGSTRALPGSDPMTTDTPNAAAAARKPTIVLIHGLWLTPLSWEGWKQRFESKSHTVLAPAWPGLEGAVEEVRQNTSGPSGSGSRRSPTTTTGSFAVSAPRPSSSAIRSAALSRSSCWTAASAPRPWRSARRRSRACTSCLSPRPRLRRWR